MRILSMCVSRVAQALVNDDVDERHIATEVRVVLFKLCDLLVSELDGVRVITLTIVVLSVVGVLAEWTLGGVTFFGATRVTEHR